MMKLRVDHLGWKWIPPGTMRMHLWWGQGWRAVHCEPFINRNGCWLPVYRTKTGFLVLLHHVPMCRWRSLTVKQRKDEVIMAVQRASASASGAQGSGRHRDKLLEERAPTLAAYLTDDSFPDGEVRQGASLTIFYDSDGVKVLLNERDQELQLWGIADSFYGLPEALEALLTAPAVAWRRPKGWKPAPVPAPAGAPLPPKRKGRK